MRQPPSIQEHFRRRNAESHPDCRATAQSTRTSRLLITSQVPVAQWHDISPTLGDAILDRIIHNAHRIELKGDSLRRPADQKKKGLNPA